MELTVNVKLNGIPTTRKAAEAAAKMSKYSAQVLLRKGDITVNAKSLIGLLSLGIKDGDGVTILALGEDEAQAVCAMSDLLQG
ncbi:MAG: HPr family phosphocarrier protein [Clostridia bacterium]|nr:HPr family phosphocarrier protein [Clostridia bacterium]